MSLIARLILWHRRSGLIVIPIVLMLSITGILINHSQTLGFAKQPVYSGVIGWLYGVEPKHITQGYQANDHWLAQKNRIVYLNTQPLYDCKSDLLGAVYWQETIAVLCDNRISLYLEDGQLVEQLPALTVQASSLGLLATNNGPLLMLAAPLMSFNDSSWSWTVANAEQQQLATNIQWADLEILPVDLAQELNRDLPLPGINTERLLLDLHSGRLFGDIGVYLVDAASLVFIFLCLSGFYTWFKRVFNSRKKKRR